MTKKKFITVITILVTLLQFSQISVFAQLPAMTSAYRVGVGDKLFMSVPQRSDLNRELIIKENGNVTLPLIGELGVIGLTTKEIENRLYQALKELYPSISKVDITLLEGASQVIHVIGQVNGPGKYNFLEDTNAWEAIRNAGGPTPLASLDNVRVVKNRDRGGTSRVVSIQAALELGTVDQLPDLEPGDTVIVPQIEEMYTGSLGVNIFGQVVRPGTYKLHGNQDLISALLLAGGTTEIASLGKIRIIRTMPDGSMDAIKINLPGYLNKGNALGNPGLKVGDTINVPAQNFVAQQLKNLRFWLSLATVGISAATLYIVLDDRRNP
ncbi:MAG: polysaccharide biosynthesis/export family protein [Candidatus Latescibacterota bacterium]